MSALRKCTALQSHYELLSDETICITVCYYACKPIQSIFAENIDFCIFDKQFIYVTLTYDTAAIFLLFLKYIKNEKKLWFQILGINSKLWML